MYLCGVSCQRRWPSAPTIDGAPPPASSLANVQLGMKPADWDHTRTHTAVPACARPAIRRRASCALVLICASDLARYLSFHLTAVAAQY